MIIQLKDCRMLPYNHLLLFLLLLLLPYCREGFSVAKDTIYPNQSIYDGQTLTSAGGIFKLGFFTPGNSSSTRYLGIWYNLESAEQVILWVANRENPLTDTTGVLRFDEETSNLVLTDASNRAFWSTNTTTSPTAGSNLTAKLQDYGNFVLLQYDGNEMWSSFDQLTDTFVPKSELSFDLRTRKNNTIINWKSKFDPSPGNFEVGFSGDQFYQLFIYVNGSIPYWRSGPWIGQRFIGIPNMTISSNWFGFHLYSSMSQDKIIFGYRIHDTVLSSLVTRFVLNSEGQLVEWLWNETEKHWKATWKKPEHKCDLYGTCGEFAICNPYRIPICECIRGFVPRSSEDWEKGVFSSGCVRRMELACERNQSNETQASGDGFFKLERLMVPDFPSLLVANETTCRWWCSVTCECLAFGYVDKNCMVWNKGLLDMKVFHAGGEDLYLKMNPSELDQVSENDSSGHSKSRNAIIIATVVGTVFLFCAILLWMRIRRQRVSKERNDDPGTSLTLASQTPILGEQELADALDSSPTETKGLESLQYDPGIIMVATDVFNVSNKLGEGGFGPVYKGALPGGQEIAVKRLSRQSKQGLKEFKNEVLLISKLQHRNLVRLLGYCINVEEKLLIYEFMPNKSLDNFLFGELKENLLDWSRRFHIIKGIAQGILYLHRDSRLRIIHRDLKASNILLDADLNPKISDFGTARIFGMDQILETNTIVGTHGYMAPEYVMQGHFSEKSDVYSFGVLLLEIVSSIRISAFYDENYLNLLSFAWKVWKEGNALELIDKNLHNSWPHFNAMKCIVVALLCVQELAMERPTMSSVVSMLISGNPDLPTPKEPPFIGRRDPFGSISQRENKLCASIYDITLTDLIGR